MSSLRHHLHLQLTEGLGPVRIAALLDHFGSAEKVIQASRDDLRGVPGIGPGLAAQLPARMAAPDVDAELQRIAEAGVTVHVRGEPGYPARLAEIPGAPWLLYMRGNLLPDDARAVALVGTREPDAAGTRMARRLSEGLSRAGVTVVSGLARGIDGIAHRAALDGGGRTLAVLAGGLSRLYPPEHRDLGRAITGSGALLTESCMEQEPQRGLFPARNRIISGLAQVVVIVQAPESSGALITAEHAAEQGRTVMAVPGQVEERLFGGCHRLIREGAILCRGVEDVLEELDGIGAPVSPLDDLPPARATRPIPEPARVPSLDEDQKKVWNLLDVPRGGDELAQVLDMAPGHLSGILLRMEMKKVIRRLPGNRYERSS